MPFFLCEYRGLFSLILPLHRWCLLSLLSFVFCVVNIFNKAETDHTWIRMLGDQCYRSERRQRYTHTIRTRKESYLRPPPPGPPFRPIPLLVAKESYNVCNNPRLTFICTGISLLGMCALVFAATADTKAISKSYTAR